MNGSAVCERFTVTKKVDGQLEQLQKEQSRAIMIFMCGILTSLWFTGLVSFGHHLPFWTIVTVGVLIFAIPSLYSVPLFFRAAQRRNQIFREHGWTGKQQVIYTVEE